MELSTAEVRKEDRKRQRATQRWRRYIEELRRRRQQTERNSQRKWLIFLLLMLLDSKPAQMLFPSFDPAQAKTPPRATQRPRRRRRANDETGERAAFDQEEHVYWDYSTRQGEHHLHVMDGLTYSDIIELHRIHRPHLLRSPAPVPGMPDRYKDDPPHVWELLDHIGSDYHRADAIIALKLVLDQETHEWIDACTIRDEGWKELKRCRMKTPDMTLAEFRRAAMRWREELRRENEERKKENNETLNNGPKPPGG